MRCLIVTANLPWPLEGGRQINAHYLMQALVDRGHEVHLAVVRRLEEERWQSWPLKERVRVHVVGEVEKGNRGVVGTQRCAGRVGQGWLVRRWQRYLGVREEEGWALRELVERLEPDYVEMVALEGLCWANYLPADVPCLWLAADEKLWFHWTMCRAERGWRQRLRHLREGLVLGLYERSLARTVDAIVTVAPGDGRAMRWVGGHPKVVVCPNGVDSEYFRPSVEASEPQTLVFWGRLDYGPNVRAVEWFAREVWPEVRRRRAGAKWWVMGYRPVALVREILEGLDGVELLADVADIRPRVQRASLVVLPLRGGSGIKNKLLEAAAMGKAILASPQAVAGLRHDGPAPWCVARGAEEWVAEIDRLWAEPGVLVRMGAAARQWVVRYHPWVQQALEREYLLAEMGVVAARRLVVPTAARRAAA